MRDAFLHASDSEKEEAVGVLATTQQTTTTIPPHISKRAGRKPEFSEARLAQSIRNFHLQDFVPPEIRPTKGAKKAMRKLVEEVIVLTKTKVQANEALSVLKGLASSLRASDNERVSLRQASLQQ